MPKKAIDYSNTLFYKIVCNDLSITDCYVGHTTNAVDRKTCHKKHCINPIYKQHNYKIYIFIRNNGGWNNFKMIPIEYISCKDVLEAKKFERKHYEELRASLNTQTPSRTAKEYYEDNKEHIQQYRQEHAEHINLQRKIFYQNNKEAICESNRIRYHANKKAIKESGRLTQYACVCGCSMRFDNKSRHFKTKIHQDYLLTIENQNV
jgi:hypothetical protein